MIMAAVALGRKPSRDEIRVALAGKPVSLYRLLGDLPIDSKGMTSISLGFSRASGSASSAADVRTYESSIANRALLQPRHWPTR